MNYMGSKARIARDIAPIIQSCIEKNDLTYYYEPFLGGANMFDKIACRDKYGSDVNNLVIDLILACKNNPDCLSGLPRPYPKKEHYYDVRDNASNYEPWYRAAILLFCSSIANPYRGAYMQDLTAEKFNKALTSFAKQIAYLDKSNCHYNICDYRNIKLPDYPVMIYCDPPYCNTTGYGNAFDTIAFWEHIRKISMNHFVLVSEYNAPLDFACIWKKDLYISLMGHTKPVVEKLFTYKSGLYHSIMC